MKVRCPKCKSSIRYDESGERLDNNSALVCPKCCARLRFRSGGQERPVPAETRSPEANTHDPHTLFETRLLDLYRGMLTSMGFPSDHSGTLARNMLDGCIQDSKKEGAYDLPPNFGEVILGEAEAGHETTEKLASIIRKGLPERKAEGVQDEDIRGWWNLKDVERRMMIATDDASRMALFIDALEKVQAGSQDEASSIAAAHVKKHCPMYGDCSDTTHSKGNDRPIPFELKDRVNRWLQARAATDPDGFKIEVNLASSFNALIRSEIKRRRI